MSHENKPDWKDLQNAQAETNAWQIDKIWTTAKKLPVYFWVMFILLAATLGNTLRMHYAMQDMVKAEFQKTELNRQQSKKFFQMRKQIEDALRDQIDKLNSDVGTEQMQKLVLANQLKKSQNLCI